MANLKVDVNVESGICMPPREYVDYVLRNALGTLITQKQNGYNSNIEREIEVTIVELEKSLAYYMNYVYPHLPAEN